MLEKAPSTLKITEVFSSLQGEARDAGERSVFIRLTGCPLRCQYCDTAYAFHGGEQRSIDDLLAETASYQVNYVCVTGGEPLAQRACIPLLAALCDAGYQVSLETSGAMDISEVDSRVSRVVDIKTPGSGEQQRNRLENIALITAHDQLKFVLCDRADFDWALSFIAEHELSDRCELWLSPSYGQVEPRELAEWIIASRAPVKLQLQLHKLLWQDTPGH